MKFDMSTKMYEKKNGDKRGTNNPKYPAWQGASPAPKTLILHRMLQFCEYHASCRMSPKRDFNVATKTSLFNIGMLRFINVHTMLIVYVCDVGFWCTQFYWGGYSIIHMDGINH